MEDQKIESNIPSPRELLDFQIERAIKQLFKQFLILIEDLENENENSFRKLKQAIPAYKSLIDQANWLDDDKMQYLRKKILSAGNDCIRVIETNLDLFNILFNSNTNEKNK